MSLLDQPTRRIVAVIAAIVSFVMLAGCFQPMLAERSDGTSVNTDLAGVFIEVMDTRVGQQVRNELIYEFGTSGSPGGATHQLSISLEQKERSQLVQRNTRVRAVTIILEATYTVTEIATDEVVHGGTVHSRASYDSSTALYANERAQIDAENRAAGVIAQGIQTRISAWFAANPAGRPST